VPTQSTQQPADITNQQLLEQLRAHMDKKSKQLDSQILKLGKEIKINEKSIIEVQHNVLNLREIIKVLTQEIFKPMLNSIPNTDEKIKKMVDNILISLESQSESRWIEEYNNENHPRRHEENTISQQQVKLMTNQIN
jgi:hypothetical protein